MQGPLDFTDMQKKKNNLYGQFIASATERMEGIEAIAMGGGVEQIL